MIWGYPLFLETPICNMENQNSCDRYWEWWKKEHWKRKIKGNKEAQDMCHLRMHCWNESCSHLLEPPQSRKGSRHPATPPWRLHEVLHDRCNERTGHLLQAGVAWINCLLRGTDCGISQGHKALEHSWFTGTNQTDGHHAKSCICAGKSAASVKMDEWMWAVLTQHCVSTSAKPPWQRKKGSM